MLFVTLPVLSSFAQLKPLVARVDQPRGPIPAECEQGLSPAPPLRVAVREIELPPDEPAEAVAPPSGALRAALHETQLALTRNDRPAFNAALARARALLLNYPSGAERRTAEDIVRLHETAARLWDTQYEAPFFGDTDPEYALVADLPGYADAMRRNTLTDDKERRFYPTAESRDFVAQVAGERLQRLGIRGTTRTTVREQPRVREQRTERPSTSPRASSAAPRRQSPRRAASTSSASTRTTRKPAVANPAPRSPNPTVPPTAAVDPAPAPTQTPTQTASSPAAGDVPTPDPEPVTTPVDPPASATTAVTETAPTTTTTAAPVADTAVTSTDVIPAAPPTSRGRSVILPALLILIGLGVLIVLFRASK